jgi:hypothetical protein
VIQPRWQLAGGAGGLLFVALVIGVVLLPSLTTNVPEPAFDGSAAAWLAYARATASQALLTTPVGIVGIFGFLLFAVCLAARFQRAEHRMSVPSILLLLAAGLTMGLWILDEGLGLATAFRAGDLDGTTASLLYGLANGVFAASWFGIAGLLVAAGLGTLASRSLPRWLGWFALVVGAGFFAAACFPLTALWLVPYALFYLWVVAVSVVLLRGAAGASRT